ncbi:helix-turn-helix transcriptional regulator [Paraburkholderia aromaticivorans]|uniref:helix-turn-helix transcriptional regulator n=1 Tax=Paraburkholderia aromaticivorans TaxID=2026199 RepID=UPI001455F1D1|nr:AlpA family transcriptional regulator [Paraburkholderia aromaticivorans]
MNVSTEIVERLIRLEEVMSRTGLTRALMYQMMKAGDFPKSVKITGRAVAWQSSLVDKWIQGRIEAAKKEKGGE